MKILFCGLGSIGKRHLQNLHSITGSMGIELNVHALRRGSTDLQEDVASLVHKEIRDSSHLDDYYDIAFVTNPTSMHFDTIKLLEGKAKNMFIEKPVFSEVVNKIDFNLFDTGVYYVAGPLRYSPVIMELKEILKSERVLSIRALCSSYLPDWRPGTDYRKSYSARKELGGGVPIDLIHEWDYITEIFGFPKEVHNIFGHISDLEITSEDIAIYIARYGNMVVELHLDYFGKHARRQIEIITDRGLIVGDILNNRITFSEDREDIVFTNERNDLYLNEMKAFINNVLDENSALNDIMKANDILKLAIGAK